MKTVGLLSGGKDSVYNLLHCVVNNHEPVALATLGPPLGQGEYIFRVKSYYFTADALAHLIDEIDSYMYQTVGNSGITSIAQALGLPLFEHTIQGTAVNMTSEYGSRQGLAKGNGKEVESAEDETEDLYQLLLKVKVSAPQHLHQACWS